jgi:UDPglucose 6-dehydrogenase
MKIAIIGLGFVGTAMYRSFKEKNVEMACYDKYKDECSSDEHFKDCLTSDVMFLCLPTKYIAGNGSYDIEPIIETCVRLSDSGYGGVVVIKSTVEPHTTNKLQKQFTSLAFVHNPEFLKAVSAFEDFHSQRHIVLGKSETCRDESLQKVVSFYETYYSSARISVCSSLESESMKLFCNSFYAVKIQFFTEMYELCKKNGCDFERVKEMMLGNNCIHSAYTQIPGPDGQTSYGGLCFPKDTNALAKYMERMGTPHQVIDAVIRERNEIRTDHLNCE